MGHLNALCLLSATMAVFSLSLALPYPFYQHEQCALRTLNLSDLAVGSWNAIYHKENLGKKVSIEMRLLNDTTVSMNYNEDGQRVSTANLTQNPNLAGKLEELVDRGSWRMAVPIFVLSLSPEYLTLYHSKANGSDDYAIYSRNSELSSENYDKALQGLTCLNLPGAKDGKPQLHKL